MKNQLTVDGNFIQGHMVVGGDYTPITGTLTSAKPTATINIDTTVFVTVLIYTAGDSDGYVRFTIDNEYAGYCSAYTVEKLWNSLSFPMRAGQKLGLRAYNISSGITYKYVVHKFYYKQG